MGKNIQETISKEAGSLEPQGLELVRRTVAV